MMQKRLEYRIRVTEEMQDRASMAGPAEALEIMIGWWADFARWSVRHGISVATAAEIFNRGIGCPVCKKPWIWDGRHWTCPNDCGCYIEDKNEPSREVAAVLREQHREEQAQMHAGHNTPAYITEREPEMVKAREKKTKAIIKAEMKRKAGK